MQIDQVYLKRLLEAFQAAPGPLTDIEQLAEAGIQYQDPQFVFHMEILQDERFVEQPDGDSGFGLIRGADWNYQSWAVVPLRLTSSGHKFLEAMRNEQIWAVMQKKFKTAGIATLVTVGTTMLETLTKQALGSS